QNFPFDNRNWNTLAFRGRLMSLLELRSAGSHRGLWDWDCALLVPSKTIAITRPTENISSRWSLAYSSFWAGFSFSTSCFTIPIHPIIIYMILLFVNSKLYLVDWNGRRRLLENTNRFSSCEVMLPKLSLSCGNSKRSSVGRTIVQSHES